MQKTIDIGDILVLKKQHPCGANKWKVIRTGADVKLQCMGCDRIVMIDRPTLYKRIKRIMTEDN